MPGQTDSVGSPDIARINTELSIYGNLDSLSDNSDLLQARRCYQFPGAMLNNMSNSGRFGCYYTVFEGLFPSLTEINSRIIQEIIKFKDKIGSPIQGQVYVILFQVPYFVNERGNPIEIGYDVKDTTNFWPSGGSSPRQTVFYRVYVYFANYDPSSHEYSKDSYFECVILSDFDSKYASNDKQCFIRCLQSNTACGCTSAAAGLYSENPSYKVKCMGRDKQQNDQLAPSSYGMLFTINQQYNILTPYFASSVKPMKP
jgi:hypothetical protein